MRTVCLRTLSKRARGIVYFILILAFCLGSGQKAPAQAGIIRSDASPAGPQAGPRYVAKSGSDAGPNNCLNPATPCLTIGQAISVATKGESIWIAQGTYLENINIDKKEIFLLGGYQEGTWNRDLSLYETIIDGSNSREVPGDWDGDRIGLPAVIAVPDGYRMWYDGFNQVYGWQMGMADSSDGITWAKYSGNPVLSPGGGTGWDSWYRGQVAILFEAGVYKMWYSGAGGDWQTGYATSPDGVAWTIYPGNPVLASGPDGSWDDIESDGPTVIHDGGLYKMWYHGCNSDYSMCGIGYATSPDGIAWTKHAANPVLTATPGTWDEPSLAWPRVIKNGSTYEMWYSANGQIGQATSTDGINWSKYANNPVIGGDWEGQPASRGSVLYDGSTYRIWFTAGYSHNRRIGYATSADGINWNMYPGNPVLNRGVPTIWGESTVSVHWTTGEAKLEGLTITGAKACREGAGGVSIDNAIARISNSIIRNNEAAGGCGGGGVGAMGGSADLILENSQVVENQANDGGGVMSWDGAQIVMNNTYVGKNHAYGWGGGGVEVMQNGARLKIVNSVIDNNTATGDGGGVLAQDFAVFEIYNTTLANNHINGKGGGLFISGGSGIGSGLQILGNMADGDGGGLSVDNAASFTLSNSLIKENQSNYAQGGGVAVTGDTILHETTIVENIAYGGAGGIAVFSPDGGGQLIAENTVIVNNHGSWGGAIAPFWRGTLTNVTVAYNTCSDCDNAGVTGAQDNLNSPHKIVNSIIYANNPGNFDCKGECDVTYSDIQGGYPGTGNFDADPQFQNPPGYEFNLTDQSPCLDAGTPNGAPDHDLENNYRPTNQGFDVGAYEYQGPHGNGPAVMRLEPASGLFYVPGVLPVKIQVDASAQLVDGAEAHLNFDPSKLQVASITAGAALPLVIQKTFDNIAGTVDVSAGAFSNFPSGTFTLATVNFNLVGKALPDTTVAFNTILPRQSDVVYQGQSVLDHLEIAKFTLRDDAILDAALGLQRKFPAPHASWATPLTVKLTRVGEVNPAYVLYPTTDNAGHFTLEGIAPGNYTIVTKSAHALATTKTATLALGPNTLSLGTLKEGDANNDNCVLLTDFSVLVSTYGKGSGAPGYDDRADFNEDNFVTILDFSLLASNYGQCGNIPAAPASGVSSTLLVPAPAGVLILIDPQTRNIKVGDTFTVSVVIEAGVQLVDGADANLDFDPTALKVLQMTGDSAVFPLILENSYNNSQGAVDYTAGTFSDFPTGHITLVTIQFMAMKEMTQTSLEFAHLQPRLTDVTYGGGSVLSGHSDGAISIGPGTLKVFLPLVRR